MAISAIASSSSPDAMSDFAQSPMTGSRPFERNAFASTLPRRRRAARTERASSAGKVPRSTVTAPSYPNRVNQEGAIARMRRDGDAVSNTRQGLLLCVEKNARPKGKLVKYCVFADRRIHNRCHR